MIWRFSLCKWLLNLLLVGSANVRKMCVLGVLTSEAKECWYGWLLLLYGWLLLVLLTAHGCMR
jgi:hypothetical protein